MTLTISDKYVVLIVDDVPNNLAMLSDALDESGHIVLVATDGISALERLDYVTPDMILLDAVMPGLDGFETCRRIKLHKGANNTPVVFMTGLTETAHVVKGFQAGGIDYVTKPIQPQEVIARIDTHIKNARLLSQARGAIDAVEHGVVALGPDYRPLWHNTKAVAWLEKYFPDSCSAISILPPLLQDWLKECAGMIRHDRERLRPLVVTRDGCELTIQFSKGARNGELLLLLEESTATETPASQISNFHLTPRESDVLAWLAKGKTNRDIGDILGMSPRTVNKHLEHIYVKLGVETRSAAAAMAVSRIYGAAELAMTHAISGISPKQPAL